ncbi:MAG TPA: ABC transporter permease [Candidatus Binatia bacterium]|nr:ABC transporter permease [Candidatus Binatia bacterium]
MPLWENPEFIRNFRAQMRPARLVGTVAITALLSWATGYAVHATFAENQHLPDWGKTFMTTALGVQLAVLGVGGGVACALSIYRERERNTYDFQRVTRLSPIELTLGKLFGAPIYFYFLAACLLPAALVGAVAGHIGWTNFLAGLGIMLVGTIVVHALALLVSLLSPRGGTGVPAALFVLLLPFLALPGQDQSDLKSTGPWAGVMFAAEGSWQTQAKLDWQGMPYAASKWTDMVFGRPVHHVPVLVILYLTLLAWLLVALVRNMKRDTADLELYSPAQSVGLVCYINLVLLAFYTLREWDMARGASLPAQRATVFTFFLGINIALLYFLGVTLLRSRDQSRRLAHETAAPGLGWRDAVWPASYVLVAAACVAALVWTRFAFSSVLRGNLDLGVSAFQIVFLLAAVLRDLSYFQWMKLRRSRYPSLIAFVFLGAFYLCSVIFLSAFGWLDEKTFNFLVLLPLPWAALAPNPLQWVAQRPVWLLALPAQLALCALFAWLHYRKIAEMVPAHGHEQSHAAVSPATQS